MKLLVLTSFYLSIVAFYVNAEELQNNNNEPINDHDSQILKLINKYHPKFRTKGKITTYYLKRKNGYKDIKLQEIAVGEKTLKIIPYSNSISYVFDHGTGHHGDGVFVSDGKNISHMKGSCGVDLCGNETYYNGKLVKISEEIISPNYLPEDKRLYFNHFLMNINKEFTLIRSKKKDYRIKSTKLKNIQLANNGIASATVDYYLHSNQIKMIEAKLYEKNNGVLHISAYFEDQVPFYIYDTKYSNSIRTSESRLFFYKKKLFKYYIEKKHSALITEDSFSGAIKKEQTIMQLVEMMWEKYNEI